jgi:hypothetical protein
MSVIIQGSQLRTILLGDKVERATATIPQTATQNIFTVSGGAILVTGLVGRVTTAIGGTATTLKVSTAPTVGTAVDLTTAVAITSKEVGSVITLPLTAGAAIIVNNGGGGGQVPGHAPYVVPAGAISITTSASTTGAIKWTLTYIMLDDGSAAAAA